MINVRIFSRGRLMAKAQNIELSPFAKTLVREFSIFNVYKQRDRADWIMVDEFQICIYFVHPATKLVSHVHELNCRIYDIDENNPKEWKVKALILMDYGYAEDYHQGRVDVWNYWGRGEDILWWQLPNGINISNYNSVCYYYSGVPKIAPEKPFFEIDCKHIQSEFDVPACFAEVFYGKRAYLGGDFHTFKDCLIILYEVRGNQFFNDKTIKLIYKNYQMTAEQLAIIEKLISMLRDFKFNLELC